MLYLNRLVLQPQHLAHGHDRYRLLTNLPNTKECIKLRIHTCAHMHAHLALLMLAVVTACCEETRRGRSKFTLVLRIIQLRAAGRRDSAILQLIQHFSRPRRIVHFKPFAIVWRNRRSSAAWHMRGWIRRTPDCCTIRFWSCFLC